MFYKKRIIIWLCAVLSGCAATLEERDIPQSKDLKQLETPISWEKPVPQPAVKTYTPPPVPRKFLAPISLTMDQNIPLKDVFLKIAEQSGLNLTFDPHIKAGISLHITDQPFLDLLEQICATAHLRYDISDVGIQIVQDKPYLHTYDLNILNTTRRKKNDMSTATNMFKSSTTQGQSSSIYDGSRSALTDESTADFWEELAQNMKMLLGPNAEKSSLGEQDRKPSKVRDASYSFAIHRQAGLLSVHAPRRIHNQIMQYLQKLIESNTKQILIEAKIVEIALDQAHQSGLDWQTFAQKLTPLTPKLRKTAQQPPLKETPLIRYFQDNTLILSAQSSLDMLLNLMEKFGEVKTLFNPRVMVLNNQVAILKSATDHVYFTQEERFDFLSKHRKGAPHSAFKTLTHKAHTVPIGVIMVVHPILDPHSDMITIALRPTISDITGEKAAPHFEKSKIPEVQIREFDAILQVPSGGMVMMGGVIREQHMMRRSGFPRKFSLFKNLFQHVEQRKNVKELVLFLKATAFGAPVQRYQLHPKYPLGRFRFSQKID